MVQVGDASGLNQEGDSNNGQQVQWVALEGWGAGFRKKEMKRITPRLWLLFLNGRT